MNPDGVSYLDISDAYLARDWSAAINAYWSPLYSWLLGAATLVIKPSGYWEFTVVHFLNFAVYALTLAAFEFLLTQVVRARRERVLQQGQTFDASDEWPWRVLGYSLFVWSSLGMIGLTTVAPDMCVAALIYLAAGIALRLRDPSTRLWLPLLFGLTLGFAYLAKAAMFPLALVFIGAGLISWRVPRQAAVRRLVIALGGFAVTAGPYVLALSLSKGTLTWGAVARIAYLWCIDGATPSVHCTDPPVGQSVVHATRRISDAPAIYEFAMPVAASYPPWYDPSRWYDDVPSRLLPVRMLARLLVHGLNYLELLAPIVVAFGVLWWTCRRSPGIAGNPRQFAALTLPASAALVMYGLVWVQPRYIAPFIVLLALGGFCGLPFPHDRLSRTLLAGASVALATVLATPLLVGLLLNAAVLVLQSGSAGRPAHVQWQVAEALRQNGLREGDAVAGLGGELPPYWARIARVRVVAEIPSREDAARFWASDSSERARVTALLEATGARGVVTNGIPSWARRDSWRALGSTGYYLLPLGR
jgi:membrane-associated protease RseP (regulator of RpoE activity)